MLSTIFSLYVRAAIVEKQRKVWVGEERRHCLNGYRLDGKSKAIDRPFYSWYNMFADINHEQKGRSSCILPRRTKPLNLPQRYVKAVGKNSFLVQELVIGNVGAQEVAEVSTVNGQRSMNMSVLTVTSRTRQPTLNVTSSALVSAPLPTNQPKGSLLNRQSQSDRSPANNAGVPSSNRSWRSTALINVESRCDDPKILSGAWQSLKRRN